MKLNDDITNEEAGGEFNTESKRELARDVEREIDDSFFEDTEEN